MSRWLVLAVLLAGCGTTGQGSVPAAPTGFAVTLQHDEQHATAPDGTPVVSWRTAWELSWQPVTGAKSYAVFHGTAEGIPGTGPDRGRTNGPFGKIYLPNGPFVRQPRPFLRVDAAAGTSSSQRLAQERAAGLLLTSSQLLVSVAAVSAAGELGPRSAWFPVGDVPPDGRPIGTGAGHVH